MKLYAIVRDRIKDRWWVHSVKIAKITQREYRIERPSHHAFNGRIRINKAEVDRFNDAVESWATTESMAWKCFAVVKEREAKNARAKVERYTALAERYAKEAADAIQMHDNLKATGQL